VIGLSSIRAHTKWCKTQLQLYSQRTTHNFLTSGFNNILLKCALESKSINWQWVSRPPASFGNTYRFLKIISGPICTTGAKTCQQDCHYCSVLQLSVGTTVIIPSAHLKVTFIANISVSMCELYNSQPGLCYETLFDCMCLQIL